MSEREQHKYKSIKKGKEREIYSISTVSILGGDILYKKLLNRNLLYKEHYHSKNLSLTNINK